MISLKLSSSIIAALILCSLVSQTSAELKFVVELYRHGARGPLGSWYDAAEQVDIQGELTATGMRQHLNLGAKLREEYEGFLPRYYNHSQIYVRSTDLNRTLMSAASQLQGMFPEGTGPLLPTNLSESYTLPWFKDARSFLSGESALEQKIQVVPIHTELSSTDLVLQSDQSCPNFNTLKSAYYKKLNDTITFVNQQFAGTYAIYSQAVNQTVKNFEQMGSLESNLQCDRYNGRYVPSFSEEALRNATLLDSLSWNFRYGEPSLLRALNTPFISQLLAYMQPAASSTYNNPLKWVMLSAHDTNVHLVSAALNITSSDCLLAERFPEHFTNVPEYFNCEQYPRFTSSLIFELHQADFNFTENGVEIPQDSYYIRLRRDGNFMNLCAKNSTVCLFDDFAQRIRDFQVPDFYAVCGVSKGVKGDLYTDYEASPVIAVQLDGNNSESSSVTYISVIILQQLIIIAAACVYFYKVKKNKKITNSDSSSQQLIESIEVQ